MSGRQEHLLPGKNGNKTGSPKRRPSAAAFPLSLTTRPAAAGAGQVSQGVTLRSSRCVSGEPEGPAFLQPFPGGETVPQRRAPIAARARWHCCFSRRWSGTSALGSCVVLGGVPGSGWHGRSSCAVLEGRATPGHTCVVPQMTPNRVHPLPCCGGAVAKTAGVRAIGVATGQLREGSPPSCMWTCRFILVAGCSWKPGFWVSSRKRRAHGLLFL